MAKKAKTPGATTTAVSRDQDLADLLRWAGEEIGVKAPKLKGGFVDGLRGERCARGVACGKSRALARLRRVWEKRDGAMDRCRPEKGGMWCC